MSTVGFGDISAGTYFGRSFMVIFISIGLVCEFLFIFVLPISWSLHSGFIYITHFVDRGIDDRLHQVI